MIRSVLAWLILAVSAPADEKQDAVIRFANEDQLPGSLESLSRDTVVWNSPIQTGPAAFRAEGVLDVALPGRLPALAATHEATLTLARGDTVKGEIASVTDDAIELDTWFAGRLKFPRVMVREVKIADRPRLLYSGPTSLEGWTLSTEPTPWKYRSGAFLSVEPGGIARDMELPDGFRLSFDATWRNQFHLTVIVYSDDASTDQPENGYEINFRGRSVQVQRCGGNPNFLQPQASVQELLQDEKAKIEIRASSRTRTLALYVNGRIIETWKDEGMDPDALGRTVHFVCHDNGRLKVSNMELSAWDGVVDETPPPGGGMGNRFRNIEMFGDEQSEPRPVKDRSLEGRMMLRNGDSVAGEVLSISEGIITLKTSFDEIRLPVARFRNIALKPASLEEPKRMIGDVRATLVDGSSLVFRLESFEKDKLRGFSQNFGTADFDLKAFSRLEFNIYNPKLDGLRAKEEW
ncbi:MAG: hypothetical protein EOP87_03990 [Verrucomicrobiaceae bacterium]|nr:MAG: hypothetical protein EOP87_03990 [Verrucomicrobiaceae bacterium]